MTIHHQNDTVTVHHGDCLDIMPTLPANSIDAIITDPPYGLEFMGKDWDAPWKSTGKVEPIRGESTDNSHPFRNGGNRVEYGCGGDSSIAFQLWCQQWATECLRLLKPGGHLLAFGGTRTWHRLACAIEEAGFEIRDSIAWLYGSGFPKSLDVSKAIDRAAGAEREIIGTRIDGCGNTIASIHKSEGFAASREPVFDITAPATDAAKKWQGWGTALKPAHEPIVVARKPLTGTVANNVQTYGTGALNIDATRIGTAGGGTSCPGGDACDCATNKILGGTKHPVRREGEFGRWPANVILDGTMADELDKQSGNSTSRRAELTSTPGGIYGGGNGLPSHTGIYGHDDSGGASRFFPTFKYEPKAPSLERPSADGTSHPTIKPLELMRWLVRLVTPSHGLVLDPFAGTGTTAEACIHEHMRAIVIEQEADYLPLITARLHKPMQVGFDFNEEGAV